MQVSQDSETVNMIYEYSSEYESKAFTVWVCNFFLMEGKTMS